MYTKEGREEGDGREGRKAGGRREGGKKHGQHEEMKRKKRRKLPYLFPCKGSVGRRHVEILPLYQVYH